MKRNKHFKELIAAIAEDGISALGVPISTLKKIGQWVSPNWLSPQYYLKWDDIYYISSFYREENLIKFPYKQKTYILPQIIEVENQSLKISLDQIWISPDNRTFEVNQSIKGRTDISFTRYRKFLKWKRKKYHEGRLARLSKIKKEHDRILLEMQPVNYETVCRTNLCMDAKETKTTKSLREIVHENGRIENLESSPIGNALGVNFILFTADCRLVAPPRSKKVVVRSNQLSPSSSGDFEFSDIYGENRNISVIDILRETTEELNITNDHFSASDITFLGITRELIRGGKPEMFFFARAPLTKKDFIEKHPLAKDSWELRSKSKGWVFWQFDEKLFLENITDEGKFNIQTDFENFLNSEGHRISVPLLTALILLMRHKLSDTFNLY